MKLAEKTRGDAILTGEWTMKTVSILVEPMRMELGILKAYWKWSHERLCMIFCHALGYTLLTTAEELKTTTTRDFGKRNVVVARGDLQPVRALIANLVSGHTKIRTQEEVDAAIKAMIAKVKVRQPRGVATNHKIEDKATRDVYRMINLPEGQYTFSDEGRCSDNLQRSLRYNNLYVADQVKVSSMINGRQCNFGKLNVGKSILIVGGGDCIGKSGRVVARWKKMSLTLICLDDNGKPCVVWFLWGKRAKDMLEKHEKGQGFHMIPFSERDTSNAFMQDLDEFRYDILDGRGGRTAEEECERLLNAKNEFRASADVTHEQEIFWKEDLSQIPCDNLKKEQIIIDRMRARLAPVCSVGRVSSDNNGPVDFRITHIATGAVKTIQSKMLSHNSFHMRKKKGEPYQMNDFDRLDVAKTDIPVIIDMDEDYSVFNELIVWSLPMRVLGLDGEIKSYIADDLSKATVYLSGPWQTKHKDHKFNLMNDAERDAYIAHIFQHEY
jgi:hypothetical protein